MLFHTEYSNFHIFLFYFTFIRDLKLYLCNKILIKNNNEKKKIYFISGHRDITEKNLKNGMFLVL